MNKKRFTKLTVMLVILFIWLITSWQTNAHSRAGSFVPPVFQAPSVSVIPSS